jgi:hypothetical protein
VLNPFLLSVAAYKPDFSYQAPAFLPPSYGRKAAVCLALEGIHRSYPLQQSEKAHFNRQASDAVCAAYDGKRSHFPTLTFGQGAYK